MKYIFLGLLWNPENTLNVKKGMVTEVVNPAVKFQWSLINGLEQNIGNSLVIINFLPVGIFPTEFSSFILRKSRWAHAEGSTDIEIGCINIPILKQLTRTILLTITLRKLINVKDEPCTIFLYSLYQPFLSAIQNIGKNIKIVCIIPDIPKYYDLVTTSWLRKTIRVLNNRIIDLLVSRIDYYVLFTKQIADVLNLHGKPFIVVEGIIEQDFEINYENCKKENVILYAGTLNFAYGIKEMLDSFTMIKDTKLRLWICGSGEGVEYVKNAASSDTRIEYRGVVNQHELKALQKRARLLINPRMNRGEYTKYSFPSKTMEYLASGTPVAAYKLDGIPSDYNDFIYWLIPGSATQVAEQIMEILSKTNDELSFFGKRAREFVLTNKNQKIQAKRIISAFALK